MLENGSKIGGIYTVLMDIGHGGTSHVYLVMNERSRKQWAAKEVSKHSRDEKGEHQVKLIADAEILKGLKHPYIPSIVDIIETEENYYVLMDFIEGRTLKKILELEGEQSQADVVKWAIQLCDVFTYLHSREPKIIYRDTKPSNIILKPDGDIALIDFGTAREYKLTQSEDTTNLGTPGYAAPEQYAGTKIGQSDERTDIYNLGATMYHLLTNHNPSNPPYDMWPIRRWNPALSSGLERVILKCTRKDPNERYQTSEELMYALQHYTQLEDKNLKSNKRKTAIMWLTGLMSVLLLITGLVLRSSAATQKRDGYEDIIRRAQSATTTKQQVDLYKQAISLNPSKRTAYSELLNRVFLSDNTFTADEAEEISRIMLAKPGSRSTNEAVLKEDLAEYAIWAYELGIAYYYYYNEEGNKPMSEPWLKIAAASEQIAPAKRERAIRLSRIASYYTGLGIFNKAGDSTVSYLDYWDDLDALSKGNISALDNTKTALVIYQEITYQIRTHANDFKKAGVTREAMLFKLNEIDSHMQTDFSTQEMADNMLLIDRIADNIKLGVTTISITFNGREE